MKGKARTMTLHVVERGGFDLDFDLQSTYRHKGRSARSDALACVRTH